MFLYSLLKSAANAVLKLMSAVIAIAHLLFVSMKSLSVSIMLLEYSFDKVKFDSTTHPMSGFLGSSPVSASNSPVFLAILKFFIIKFSVWLSPTPTPRTKISIDVPVDRISGIKSRLEAGMSSRPSWAAQEGSSRSVLMYFMLSRSTSCARHCHSFHAIIFLASYSHHAPGEPQLIFGSYVWYCHESVYSRRSPHFLFEVLQHHCFTWKAH